MKIRRLTDRVVQQLAAGEVVENPASVVRELIANAIDAGATSVRIMVKRAGLGSIIIEDDGDGMDQEDLPSSLLFHHTSKVPAEDIHSIHSLGFRGEALPSIASVARLVISSRTAEQEHGWKIVASYGLQEEVVPCRMERGTRVEVTNLFAAQPARLSFMKSEAAELTRIRKVIVDYALAHPEVAFTLQSGRRELLRIRQGSGDAERLRLEALLGAAFAEAALPLHPEERDGIRIAGWLHVPGKAAARRDLRQHISVNGQPVKDRLLSAAVQSAVRHLVGREVDASFVLRLRVRPDLVNVNIHPRKEEVRFSCEDQIREVIRASVAASVRHAGLDAAAELFQEAKLAAWNNAERVQQLVEQPLGEVLGQAHHAWIISQTPDGIAIIDQHAAHERMILEDLKEGLIERRESVPLPTPLVVALAPEQKDALVSAGEALADFGLVMESFDGDSICVQRVPRVVAHVDPTYFVTTLARELLDEGGNPGVLRLLDILSLASCRAAIKSGDRLSQEELDSFIRRMEQTPNATRCVHGRPSVLFLSNKDIENLFQRS